MRYVIPLLFLLVAMSSANWPETTGRHCALAPRGGGGPDSFGYRYLDSDTTCPGAPVFNWAGIKGIGTRVNGLGDDNYVGPFGIGFEFPYYGYRVDTVYVGSDGYVTFTHGSLPGLPPNPIPDTSEPNNTVAPLLSDLDCSAGGSVWCWTSADADTFIIEYDSIRFWSTGGNNTFQIILSKPDSTIAIQYKEQSGAPYGGWAPEHNQTGIEDSSGAVGLNYLSGTFPPQNTVHDSLAVLFIPPDSTAPGVYDVDVRGRRGASVATFLCHLPDHAAVFDAMGRMVLNPKPGVYFVREEPQAASPSPQAVRKVVIAR
jgi:hypothetical protein